MMISLILFIISCLNSHARATTSSYKQAHARAAISLSNGKHFVYDVIMFTNSASDLILENAPENAEVKGTLIPISFLDPDNRDTACTRFQLDTFFTESLSSYPSPNNKNSWIALARRGECALTEMVRNVQAIGAMAIVIDEDYQIEEKINKLEVASDLNIPVFFVTSSTYRSLQMAASYNGKRFYPKSAIFQEEGLVIAIERNVQDLKNGLVRVNVVIFLILFLLAWLTASYSVRIIPKLTSSAFTVQPVIKYDQLNIRYVNESTCAVCLDDFKSDDDLRVLASCKHLYHSRCILVKLIIGINSWLVKTTECPVCLQEVGESCLNIS